MKKPRKHFHRGGPRVHCGLKRSKTLADTRHRRLTTCINCLRVLRAEAKP